MAGRCDAREPLEQRELQQRLEGARRHRDGRQLLPGPRRDHLVDAARRERRGVDHVHGATGAGRVRRDGDHRVHHEVDGHHVERRERVAGERQRDRERRRDEQDRERVRPLEPVDLAGPRVADHDARPVDRRGQIRLRAADEQLGLVLALLVRRCGIAGAWPARPRGSRRSGRRRRSAVEKWLSRESRGARRRAR